MFRPILVTLLGLGLLGGCATKGPDVMERPNAKVVPEDQVVIVDPTAVEKELYGKVLSAKPTPDVVTLGMKDGVTIEVWKEKAEYDPILEKSLQIWSVIATNFNPVKKCVGAKWRLMEFEYVSLGPTIQLIHPMNTRIMGKMQQKAFRIGNIVMTPNPSGYLADMVVRDARMDAKLGEECMFLVHEEDYTPDEDVIEK